ncbi:MAG: HNH endonuclease [Cytophagaceae bacterium]|nr:MAG: HNH endonuclease [Cytophagaceae bacterium]
MATLVNLDAMIHREDFEVGEEEAQADRLGKELKLGELISSGITFNTLRKPDFQRETASWSPDRIAEFVKSFVDGDLIPALIMWRSPRTGNNFVIDGAHRLSSLIAWVHDDYGDTLLSRPFFNGMIEPAQIKAARRTRELIDAEVGAYRDLARYPAKPDSAPNAEALKRARNMGSFTITLQWVQGGAQMAEKSFFRINQSAAEIDPTELALIKARRKPTAIATRALIRAGTGHKYWSGFAPATQDGIEQLAKEVYEDLFRPIVDYPIKTLDLPAAGTAYTADSVKMVFDLVNYLVAPSAPGELADDSDGSETLRYLRSIRRSASRVFGKAPGSLGLHPGIFCYSVTGKFQPTAFIATIAFVRELDERAEFPRFTKVRGTFERFLRSHLYFLNQIGSAKGSGTRSLPTVLTLYRRLMEACEQPSNDDANILAYLQLSDGLGFLQEPTDEDRKYGRNFTRETKSAIFLKEALARCPRCEICDGLLHFKAISFDHDVRREDGGMGDPDNGHLTHPYCNTGFKEQLVAKERAGHSPGG